MRLSYYFVVAIFVIVMLHSNPMLAGKEVNIKQSWLEGMTSCSDIIVKGRIVNVEVKYIPWHEVFLGIPKSDAVAIITELTISIDKVITGEYDKETIKAVLKEGKIGNTEMVADNQEPLNPQVGDSIIVALQHNKYGYDRYILTPRYGLFKIINDSIFPYDNTYTLGVDDPLSIMEHSAKQRTFEALYDSSDVVCVGKVISNDMNNTKIVFDIDEVLKGEIEQSRITIEYKYILTQARDGMRLLIFLRRQGSTYSNIAGENGVYLIDNDGRLIRGFRSIMLTTLTNLKTDMSKKKDKQR